MTPTQVPHSAIVEFVKALGLEPRNVFEVEITPMSVTAVVGLRDPLEENWLRDEDGEPQQWVKRFTVNFGA